MSINFNPNVSLKPAPAGELSSIKNVPSKETPKNEGAKTAVQTADGLLYSNSLTLDIMTAAELAARASILMAQEYGMPYEVAVSADIAEDFYNKALGIADEIRAMADTVAELYDEGAKTAPDGTFLRDIFPGKKEGEEIMIEYNLQDGSAGTVLRESIFKDGVLQRVEEFLPDGKRNVLTLNDGKPVEYMKGLVEYGKDAEKEGKSMDKYFTFENGVPMMYFEDYTEFTDGNSSTSRWLWFDGDGKMSAYYEDMANDDDGSTVGLHLRYNANNELCEYVQDIKNGIPQGKHYELIDDKWTDKSLSAAKTAKEK